MDKRNTTSGIFFILLAVFALVSSIGLGIGKFHNPQPGFLPFAASIFLIFFCLALLIITFHNKNEEVNLADLWHEIKWQKNIIVFLSLIIYCFVLSVIGYIPATFALMTVLFSLEGMKKWAVIVSSLLAVFLSYGLFQYLLKTPLPRPMWVF